MQSWSFKAGVSLIGASLLGFALDFLFLSDSAMMPRILPWYLAIGGLGAVLVLVARKA